MIEDMKWNIESDRMIRLWLVIGTGPHNTGRLHIDSFEQMRTLLTKSFGQWCELSWSAPAECPISKLALDEAVRDCNTSLRNRKRYLAELNTWQWLGIDLDFENEERTVRTIARIGAERSGRMFVHREQIGAEAMALLAEFSQQAGKVLRSD
jgi:hypothetical protein